MGCGTKCLRALLIAVNIVFFLTGIAILALGIWIRVDKTIEQFKGAKTDLEEFRNSLYTMAYILIGLGSFTLIVGFCGCCGALRDSKALLGVYIALVVLVLGGEIAGGVLAYIQKDKLVDEFTKKATDYLVNEYGKSSGSEGDMGFDFVMSYFDCCGVNSLKDFVNSTYSRSGNYTYPPACCKSTYKDGEVKVNSPGKCDAERRHSNTAGSELKMTGCKDKVVDFFKDKSTLLLGVAGGIAGFELIVILAATIFCCSIGNDD